VIDVTVLGEVLPERNLTRAGARPGDAIFVTGHPGLSAGGLELILHPELRAALTELEAQSLLEAHWRPQPRIAAAQAASASGGVSAAIDVSDGLAADLGHVLNASGVGATLDEAALPVPPALAALERAGGPPARSLALAGGEAYELLLTCRPEAADATVAAIVATGLPAHRIGTIEAAPGLRLRAADGSVRAPARRGHDHFKGAG
jgi:thiamine-monophosphate kinase